MAVGTITRLPADAHGSEAPVIGDMKLTVTTVVGPASYTTGGDTLTVEDLGLEHVLFATAEIIKVGTTAADNNATSATYNVADQTLQFFNTSSTTGTAPQPSTLAETASTKDLSQITVQIIAFGY